MRSPMIILVVLLIVSGSYETRLSGLNGTSTGPIWFNVVAAFDIV